MKKTSIVWFFVLTCLLQVSAQDFNREFLPKDSQRQKIDLAIAPSDLQIDGELISVNINGLPYSVESLRKEGTQWIATVDAAVDYCPQGHPMCGRCGLCHLRHCRYYVVPCW